MSSLPPSPSLPRQQSIKKSSHYGVVVLSFLKPNLDSRMVNKAFEQALGVLQPGGRLYMIDWDGEAVKKLPEMAQEWLEPVTKVQAEERGYEEQTRQIVQAMGKKYDSEDVHQNIRRWSGVSRH
jgi:hypothetical protein